MEKAPPCPSLPIPQVAPRAAMGLKLSACWGQAGETNSEAVCRAPREHLPAPGGLSCNTSSCFNKASGQSGTQAC